MEQTVTPPLREHADATLTDSGAGVNISTPSNEEVLAVIHLHAGTVPMFGLSTDEDRSRVIDMMREKDPESLYLVYRLSTTGSPTAQQQSAKGLSSHINGIISNLVSVTNNADPQAILEASYQECLGAYEGTFNGQVILNWSFHNVATEAGITDYLDYEMAQHFAYGKLQPLLRLQRPDSYWRGVAALYLALQHPTIRFSPMDHQDFIEWAASIDDLGPLVRLARESNSFDVESLKEMLENQRKLSPGLQAGAL